MARKWSNLNLPGALHYVTGNVLNRIPTFKQQRCCLEFLNILRELLQKWPCKMICYVIMPDPFHLIVNPRDGNIRKIPSNDLQFDELEWWKCLLNADET